MEEQTLDLFYRIFETDEGIGNLLKVEYIFDLNLNNVVAIILSFEDRVLTIQAVADDDTIEIFFDRANENKSSQHLIPVSQNNPWSMIVNRRIQWGWALINQQGYHDAIQFEFCKDGVRETVIIQIITAASSLWIYELNKINFDVNNQ